MFKKKYGIWKSCTPGFPGETKHHVPHQNISKLRFLGSRTPVVLREAAGQPRSAGARQQHLPDADPRENDGKMVIWPRKIGIQSDL